MPKSNTQGQPRAEMPKTIAAALFQVFSRVAYVQKTGKMSHGQRYTFASEGDLISALRPAMVEAGLMGPMPITIEATFTEHARSNQDRRQFRAEMKAVYRFLHVSGEFQDVEMAGVAIDTGDKALWKALTGAYKYVLRETFQVETGDDPDTTPSADQEAGATELTPHAPEPTNGQAPAMEHLARVEPRELRQAMATRLNDGKWTMEQIGGLLTSYGVEKVADLSESARQAVLATLNHTNGVPWTPKEQ